MRQKSFMTKVLYYITALHPGLVLQQRALVSFARITPPPSAPGPGLLIRH